MPINTRPLADVTTALTSVATTESDFRTAEVDIATQVDANQIDLAASRSLSLTGDVTGTTTFDLSDDGARAISVATTVTGMSITGSDLVSGTVTNTQIGTNTITQNRIADGAKQRLRILSSSGAVLFEMDGLRPN